MFLIGSLIIVIIFILLFCAALILDNLGYGSTDDIHTISGKLAYISIILPMLLLFFLLLSIEV